MNNIEFMNSVAKDIINMEITSSITYKEAKKEFYEIMKKYGIKEGTRDPNGHGITVANFEWTMCKTLFDSMFNSRMMMESFFDNDMPEELKAY